MMGRYHFVSKALRTAPVAILLTLANVFISFCVASVVFFQIFITRMASKEVAVVIAIIAATLAHMYILRNHKIQKYISSKDNVEE